MPVRNQPESAKPNARIELYPPELLVNVEETAVLQAMVSNEGDFETAFAVEVVGINETWFDVLPASQLILNPGEQQTVAISVTAPHSPDNLAGTYQFNVRVVPFNQPKYVVEQTATLTVNPFYEFSVGELTPKRQTIRWSKEFARYALSVTNKGNSKALFQLEGGDTRAECRFEIQLPYESAPLTGRVECFLPPNSTTIIPVLAFPQSNALVQLSRRQHQFSISVALPRSGQLPRSVLGELTQKPLIGPGMLLLAMVAVILLGAAIINPLLEYTPVRPLIAKSGSEESDSFGLFSFDLPPLPSFQTEPESLPAEVEEPPTYEAMFQEIGPQYNVDWRILEAVAYRESRMNYQAMGKARDMGLMQVIPSTWHEWAPKVDVYDPFDPHSNITVGAAYLAFVKDFCAERGHPEPQWMLVAYNWGPNRLDHFWENGGTWHDLPRTQRNYAFAILDLASKRAMNPGLFDEIYASIKNNP